jgi:hypothetical protein
MIALRHSLLGETRGERAHLVPHCFIRPGLSILKYCKLFLRLSLGKVIQ